LKACITKINLSQGEVKQTAIRKGAVKRLFGSRIPLKLRVNDLRTMFTLMIPGYPDPGYIWR
jgi:hypothetical protein